MKNMSILLSVFLLLTIPSFAQAEYSPFEVFGGYNFVSLGGDSLDVVSMNGWNMAFTGNLNSTFGIKAEIAGIYSKQYDYYPGIGFPGIVTNVKVNGSQRLSGYSFMFGPQVGRRPGVLPARVFGHALFGRQRTAVNGSYEYSGTIMMPGGDPGEDFFAKGSNSESTNSFAMALGGGFDWNVGNLVIRVPQIDYFPWVKSSEILNDSWIKSDETLNNFRISAGVLFRFGNRR